jgi:hypothetical protein
MIQLDKPVHDRLSSLENYVGSRVMPVGAANGSSLPFVTYQFSAPELIPYTDQPSLHGMLTLFVTAVAVKYNDAKAIADRARELLHYWQEAPIKIVFFRDESFEQNNDEQPEFYRIIQTYHVHF